MRIWIDLTNSPHVLVMRPVIEHLRADGHDVVVTTRDFSQTIELCERFAIPQTPIGRHRGERLLAKAGGLASRSSALVRFALADARAAGGKRFDIALGHGSNDVTLAAAALRIPSATMFDYEWAAVQHHVNCRLARAVVVPDAIPAERLAPYGAEGKIRAYPGLKEEYYLADFEPDPAMLVELALDPHLPIAVIRTPPEVSLYHRFENDLFARVLHRAREAVADVGLQPVVLPRTATQRAELAGEPGFLVPPHAIDAQSLIAHADLVISAGGTMNREAVALGTPVYSTFEGRLGAVDEQLIAQGRLQKLSDPDELGFAKRPSTVAGGEHDDERLAGLEDAGTAADRTRRDPALLVELLLSPLTGLESP
jgi:uncharacterized protein